MKKKLFIFALVATLIINIFTKANAEQYVLACKIKISAVHMLTNKVLRTYMIDRYFIGYNTFINIILALGITSVICTILRRNNNVR